MDHMLVQSDTGSGKIGKKSYQVGEPFKFIEVASTGEYVLVG